jgi:hypothetical protein
MQCEKEPKLKNKNESNVKHVAISQSVSLFATPRKGGIGRWTSVFEVNSHRSSKKRKISRALSIPSYSHVGWWSVGSVGRFRPGSHKANSYPSIHSRAVYQWLRGRESIYVSHPFPSYPFLSCYLFYFAVRGTAILLAASSATLASCFARRFFM